MDDVLDVLGGWCDQAVECVDACLLSQVRLVSNVLDTEDGVDKRLFWIDVYSPHNDVFLRSKLGKDGKVCEVLDRKDVRSQRISEVSRIM